MISLNVSILKNGTGIATFSRKENQRPVNEKEALFFIEFFASLLNLAREVERGQDCCRVSHWPNSGPFGMPLR